MMLLSECFPVAVGGQHTVKKAPGVYARWMLATSTMQDSMYTANDNEKKQHT